MNDMGKLKSLYDCAHSVLTQIAGMKRKTKEQRMAWSCINFLDAISHDAQVVWTEADIQRLDAALNKCFPEKAAIRTDSTLAENE